MTHRRGSARAVLAGFLILPLAALSLLASEGHAAGATKKKPHIVATPNNVMVNKTVTLVGRHFAPKTKIVLSECGATTWIAPKDPCNKKKIHVTTNKHGGFTRSFTMTLCPRSPWPGHPITEERCYVGEVMPSGVDVIDLIGHVKIIVTYP
jgi:hypothetical protein